MLSLRLSSSLSSAYRGSQQCSPPLGTDRQSTVVTSLDTSASEPEIQPDSCIDNEDSLEASPMPTMETEQINESTKTTEQLLADILEQLKKTQRDEMFGEFSIMRLLAGILQVVVLFCLLVGIWFLMSAERQDNFVLISLGFAIVLQLMSLTFYIMHRK